MTKIDSGITVILPCAGSGSRLGLDGPKELYEIFPGVRLIDFSLRHIRAFMQSLGKDAKEHLKVAVVTRHKKLEVSQYVERQFPDIQVWTVFFNDEYHDWPGSVFSAAMLYSAKNIVLLPDSFLALSDDDPYHDSTGDTLIESMNRQIGIGELVFGAIPCSDPARLRNLGALFVEDQSVTCFCDKPEAGFDRYNSFWGCYGFSHTIGSALYDFMSASVQKRPLACDETSFFPATAIPVSTYTDLGTWPSIAAFRADRSSTNNSSK